MKISHSPYLLRKIPQTAFALLFFLGMGRPAIAQMVEGGLLRVGGFRCASVKPLKNDSSLDLYRTGYWN